MSRRQITRKAIALPVMLSMLTAAPTMAQVAGGTLDPTTIPKYKIPLVIPPVMRNDGADDSYDIAVREFKQQILPGGIWNSLNGRKDKFSATRVWSYGPAADPKPAMNVAPAANSQFNYPAYTIETTSGTQVDVRWINDLVDEKGKYLEHLLPIDQTVHWANPPMECREGESRTDCAGISQEFYEGPVPIITHVHGAHVGPESDGYPEAWYLPAANNIPPGYATSGRLFDDATGTNDGTHGFADFEYPNAQPATTLWYHDHSLGMTRNNVYAGPAGFWLVRGGSYDGASGGGVLPGPAPVAGESLVTTNFPEDMGGERHKYREIPIVIQDRSFNNDGSLFYPRDRAFFEGLAKGELKIPFVGDPDDRPSDVLPTWNPEAFFNVMVVNGVAWPELRVAPALYRFRFLNGCNSRFLWLKFDDSDVEVYQIGAEQGFLPEPEELDDGILMGLAERADVIVDFRGLSNNTKIKLLNIGPDEPFGGGEPGVDFDPADPDTTGQVMRFVVDSSLDGLSPTDPSGANSATNPWQLVLNAEPALPAGSDATRELSLNEGESEFVCVYEDAKGRIRYAGPPAGDECPENSELAGPTEALLGTYDSGSGEATPLKWTDDSAGVKKTVSVANGNVDVWVTENPDLNDTEEWDIYNLTEDAHPIHLHLVRFQVQGREPIGGVGTSIAGTNDPLPWETGYKDTVIAYPGEVTTIKAKFDMEGLYVWHCHIVEHEDNEMMRPYCVGDCNS